MRQHRFHRVLSLLLAALMTLSLLIAVPSAVFAASAGSVELFVQTAANEINYYEEADGSTKYGTAFGNAKLADWDCAFVAWCAGEAGVSSDVIPRYTDVNAMQSFFKGLGLYQVSYAHGGTYSPKAGDIAFLSLTSDKKSLTSVGIVEKTASGEITVIEGNCPNRVRRNTYTPDNKTLIGFAAPKYLSGSVQTTTTAPAGYATGIYTLNYNMNLRSAANTSAAILAVIPKDTVVLVDQIDGEWGHTSYNGNSGWMSLQFSTLVGNTENKRAIGKYRTDYKMNFRSAPQIATNNIIGSIPAGTILTVTEISGDWGKTEYDGKTGWVSLEYCTAYTPGANDPVTNPAETTAADVNWTVIDISRHNAVGNFNWSAIKAAGVMGVILRVGGRGYGSDKQLYDDVAFYQHYTRAKAAGLHIGAYFYSYALTEAQAKEEAQLTIDLLRSYNAKLDMPVYIDIEDYVEDDYTDNQHARAGKAACTKVVDTFCKAIKNAGYYPGVYCNKNFAENLLDKSVFEGRALWIAHYASVCGYTQSKVGMWQYTSSGKVNGYSGQYLDMNICYVNYPAVIAGTVSHTNPNPTPAGGEEKQPDTNVADPTPTVQRNWELTKAPTCTEDGVESIFEGATVYMKRSVAAAHGEAVNCVLRTADETLQAGQVYDLQKNADKYYDETSPYYQAKCSDARNNGGCLFSYCSDCGEILKVDYYYKSGCSHDYQAQVISAASCTKEGVTKTVCSKCGKTGSEYVAERTEHTSGDMQYYEGTSGAPSYYGILCSKCSHLMYASYNFIAGDVDGNMKVDSADARLTLRHAIGLEQISTEYRRNADYNSDGVIDPADARLILRKSVNLE